MVTEELLEPIEIGFGYEFEISGYPGNKQVIIRVGRGKKFGCSDVTTVDGKEALAFSGTEERVLISQITGHWDYSRIESAYMVNFGDKVPIGKFYDLLREQAKEKPRFLR